MGQDKVVLDKVGLDLRVAHERWSWIMILVVI